MRLYTRTGATALDDPEYGHFEADAVGGFDFPEDLSDRLHRFAVRGQPAWETDVERQQRLLREEMERRRDPATMMDAMDKLVRAAEAAQAASTAAQVQEPVEPKAPVRRVSRRAASTAE